MMGGGGPMISGNWINTKTGETVTVRDSFMDGEDMIIFLTNGRQLTLSEFQDYVQQSEEEYDEHGNMISKTNGGGIQKQASPKPHHKPANVDAATVFAGLGDDKPADKKVAAPPVSDADGAAELEALINGGSPAHAVPRVETSAPKDMTEGLQAVSKIIHRSSSPKFKVSVEWNDFPKEELEMAKKFFDATDDDITKAIIGMHCTGHELEAAIAEWLVGVMRK